MNPSIQDLADANLLQAIREHARWQAPCECVETNGVLMMAGANAFPGVFRNCVARTDGSVHAAGVLERAQSFFSQRGPRLHGAGAQPPGSGLGRGTPGSRSGARGRQPLHAG